MSTTPPPPPPTPVPAAPAKKSNTLLIVLCVVFGFIILLLGSCVATCVYMGKKAKDYVDESEKNPQLSALSIAAALHPGIEVVSKDMDAGTMVLRNKKTGETVELNARQLSADKIAEVIDGIAQGRGGDIMSRTDRQPSVRSEPSVGTPVGSTTANAILEDFPPDFPVYAGATTLDAAQQNLGGMSSSQHTFTTTDSPAQVVEFYDGKLKAAGYVLAAGESGSDGAGPAISRIYRKDGIAATFSIAARIENNKTRVEASRVLLKQ